MSFFCEIEFNAIVKNVDADDYKTYAGSTICDNELKLLF
jgi:hypothetical protein